MDDRCGPACDRQICCRRFWSRRLLVALYSRTVESCTPEALIDFQARDSSSAAISTVSACLSATFNKDRCALCEHRSYLLLHPTFWILRALLRWLMMPCSQLVEHAIAVAQECGDQRIVRLLGCEDNWMEREEAMWAREITRISRL